MAGSDIWGDSGWVDRLAEGINTPYSATAQILGHIGRDVETRLTSAGKPMHKFSLYTADGPKDEKKFSWFDVVVFGDMPQFKLDAIVKGATAFVTGRLEVREYEAKDGSKGKQVQITADSFNGVNVVAPPKEKRQEQGSLVSQPRSSRPAAPADQITDEEIPF